MKKGQKRKARRKTLYTRGEQNKIVDALVHPLIEKHWVFRLVDELGHAAIEQDPKESITKFARYSLPQIIRWLLSEEE